MIVIRRISGRSNYLSVLFPGPSVLSDQETVRHLSSIDGDVILMSMPTITG